MPQVSGPVCPVERSRREDEEMFKKWEADLRRREDELRRRTAGGTDPV